MPYKPKYKKSYYRKTKYGKKKYKKTIYSNKSLSSLSIKGPSVVPDRMFVKMKYSEIVALSPGTTNGSYMFSGNSIFDPNVTAVGTQPTGYDQWSGFYSKYRVRASKIKIRSSSGSSVPVTFSLVPTNSSVAITGYNESIRLPRAKSCMLGVSGNTVSYCKNYAKSKVIMGENLMDDNSAASFGSNPVNRWYWIVWAQSIDNLSHIVVYFEFEVTYYVELYNRVDLDLS